MTFKPGQSGNPKGRSGERVYADAIRAATNVVDPVSKRIKLLEIATKVVDLAVAGESWACAMVADRLDGKPHQESTVNVNHSIAELADAEIATRIDELRAGRVGATNGNGEAPHDPSQLN